MRKVIPFLILIIISIALAGRSAKAQTEPFILITWKALNYAPANFEGKVLPMQNSPIVASVALLQNGKFIDVSKMQIKWTLNDNVIKSGYGLQTITFFEPDIGGRGLSSNLQVEFPDYSGGFILNSIQINPVLPQVVIDAPYPQNQFSNQEITVRSLPYFFNVNDISGLNISWTANSQSPTSLSDPSLLDIKLNQAPQEGNMIYIGLSINQKATQLLSSAANSIILYYK
ncbi:MAG: hypothetical protein M1334_00830 [Patescibacteria group bacterium]|nr:hypothetical protein [Patescibacteria group bacterium]